MQSSPPIIPFSLRRNIDRIQASSAQVVMLIAPAGFGKTTISQKIAEYYRGRNAVCDCSEIVTTRQLAHGLIAALAAENPAEEMWLSQLQLDLTGVESDADWLNSIDNAWQKTTEEPTLFIFENCETLLRTQDASLLLRRLVSTAPPSRRIILCSRTPLSIHAGRTLPPHRVMLLTTKDLALTHPESQALLADSGIASDRQESIIALAQGWPVVLLLLRRLAEEGKLEGALQNAYSLAFDDLFPYLYQEILAPLPTELRRAATICAAVPDLTTEEMRFALGDRAMTQIDLHNVPLLEVRNDRYSIHPFVRELLLKENPHWREAVNKIARWAEQQNRTARAAKLYRLSNDVDSAARALADLSIDDLLTSDAALELASIPLHAIREHPKLALTFMQHTRITRQLQLVLEQAFEKALTGEDNGVVVSVAAAAIEANHWMGNLERAASILATPELQKALEDCPEPASASLLGAQAIHGVLAGKVESNIDALYAAYNESLVHPLAFRSSILATYIAYAERWRGEREASLEMTEASVAHALGSKYPLVVIGTLAEAYITAWFWGDDALATRYRKLLATWREEGTHELSSTSLFSGTDPEEPGVGNLPSTATMYPFLVAASDPNNVQKASHFVRRAYGRAFAEGGLVLSKVAATLARGASSSLHEAPFDGVLSLIDRNELPALYDAVVRLSNGHDSFLTVFVNRFATVPSLITPAVPRESCVVISILNESIEIAGNRIVVSPREAACLAVLARRRSGVPRDDLQEAIWPDLSDSAARDALYSLLYRLRKRAGDYEMIENIGNAYRYSSKTLVDLWEVETAAQRARRGVPPPYDEVERAFDMIERRSWPHLLQFDWFPALEFRVKEASRTLVRHLIDCCMKAQNFSAVLAYAHKLLVEDECDEWAHEMIIRAYLGQGTRIEAIRAYRNYMRLVQREVGSLPSPDLQAFAERHALIESKAS